MDLVALIEAMRNVQAQLNMYGMPLAWHKDAWGDLDRAMRRTLTEHYRSQGYHPKFAQAYADRVIDEIYHNGEGITYNMRLLAIGDIEVREDLDPCNCEHLEHTDGTAHPYLGVPLGTSQAAFVGAVCDECAEGHMAPYLTNDHRPSSDDAR